MKKIEDLTSSRREHQNFNDHPLAFSQPNPVRHQPAFSSSFNPFTAQANLFSPIGNARSTDNNQENQNSSDNQNAPIPEADSFATPSGARYSYNSDSNEEEKQDGEENDSDYVSDDVVDLNSDKSDDDDEDDDEDDADLVDDLNESIHLQDDLHVPIEEIRRQSMEGKRLSEMQSKKSKSHKKSKSTCSLLKKILLFPFKLLSVFWITTIIFSIIFSRIGYVYFVYIIILFILLYFII